MDKRMSRPVMMAAAFLVVAVVVGCGLLALAYSIGASQGAARAPIVVENGSPAQGYVPSAPYAYRPWGYGFGFSPFNCLFPLFGILLVFFLVRRLIWGCGYRRHFWRRGFDGGRWGARGVPPFAEDWHRKMHGERGDEGPDNEESDYV